MTALNALRRLDAGDIDERRPECRLVLVVRNEELRLPWFFSYHRALGVERFFVIDNESEDGTLSFLSQQKDCHIFSTGESYAASGYGTDWQKWILQQYGGNHWWITIDADEMLVYPASETIPLPLFCRYLDGIGAQGMYTTLIDMYSRGSIAQAVYKAGQSFLDVCAYFDDDYIFRPRLKMPFASEPFPSYEPIGGPRLRCFYPEYYKSGRFPLLWAKVFRHLRNALRRIGIKLNIDCAVPPLLFNVRLVKAGPWLRLMNSHMVEPLKLASVTGATLHFKFFADFHERVVREFKRGEHFDGGSEYARYLKALQDNPAMSFCYEKSIEYKSTDQLVKRGLMKDDVTFVAFRAAIHEKTN